MYHSIKFGDKNTWDDWKLVPSSRPVFNPPRQKTQYLDIPGADGVLDVSEALTGYPVFENREGSLEFIVYNDYQSYRWQMVYETISNYLHGQRMRAILEDDPNYFYEGRFQVDKWSSEKDYSRITINYTVKPYKYELLDSVDSNWLWDPFNFETDYISHMLFRSIIVNSDSAWVARHITYREGGLAPFCPEFRVELTDANRPITVRYYNPTINRTLVKQLKNGTTFEPEMMVFGGDVTLSFQGHGTVSVIFRKGRL